MSSAAPPIPSPVQRVIRRVTPATRHQCSQNQSCSTPVTMIGVQSHRLVCYGAPDDPDAQETPVRCSPTPPSTPPSTTPLWPTRWSWPISSPPPCSMKRTSKFARLFRLDTICLEVNPAFASCNRPICRSTKGQQMFLSRVQNAGNVFCLFCFVLLLFKIHQAVTDEQ